MCNLRTTIERLEELQKYVEIDCSDTYIVALDDGIRVLRNVEKLLSATKAYEELLGCTQE